MPNVVAALQPNIGGTLCAKVP